MHKPMLPIFMDFYLNFSPVSRKEATRRPGPARRRNLTQVLVVCFLQFPKNIPFSGPDRIGRDAQ